MAKDERRMTFIVVPHGGGDLNTRSFEVSYRQLRTWGLVVLAAVLLWIVSMAVVVYLSAQAARVPVLKSRIAKLEAANEQVEDLARSLLRLEQQYEQVRQMLGAGAAGDTAGLWLPPVQGAEEGEPGDSLQSSLPTSWPLTDPGFVTRGHLGRVPGQHPGIDIAIAEGSYIRASASGRVVAAGEDSVYGKFVQIRHGSGYETMYAHASQLFVAARDSVERHQVVALTGNTGTSTAPHLHFEIRKDGEPIDPRTLVHPPS